MELNLKKAGGLMVSFEEFKKIELKSAKILAVEDIAGKDKLYKLQIDLGTEKRQLVAGIKQYYSKEELLGKTIIVVANLEPAVIAGNQSNGMLLAVKTIEGKYSVLTVEGNVAAGTLIE